MGPTTLRTLLGDYPNTLALKRGEIASPLVGFEFDPVKTANRAFKRVVREGAFDVAELALVTFLQAKAYGKPLVLMPAVVGAGRYQHHCLVHNVERGRLRVAELAGRRIGIRAYAQTTVAWVRGILADDYGVDLSGIRWVTFEDGHLAEFPDPPGVARAEGRNMVEMLLAGELDAAIIGTDLPDDPRLAPVLPDPHAAAAAWGARHAMVPVNHMVAVDRTLCERRPEVVREVYRLLQESKAAARRDAGGPDLTPFGVEPNRHALELIIHYAYDQKLIPRRYAVDELFDDVTRVL
ncbi:phosphate ABC transporter substrate-binding protein [Pigmentiphaga sp. NML030171]|uniref:phosphate ABC transporter substrate-binding protein n=1 Tax=Pigmentiphaga sp. NML030171 TaxID=2008676 RepID=UPI000B42263F|nr:phosphate ABC transporter substrate-binding protein [Pigmentiphaga sp. NML030171]OVZ58225.1 phosphate ABC transporter substrate-binding protein [Pigmentiphaga sp. NML030171]